ncbi:MULTISPECIES: nucleotide exchange factor GrpE [Paenibacillus]|uniref:nucleotide exchange factor GrpE n=1 Tax=Paenibacillus TaxID=44249 RepID=UPI000BBDE312|nr:MULTISPECIES: nucleotide exchange factor GrpE [Paenibacillus]PCL94286.1 nucleotide exchange factor GrpE [Paenibacillus lautus]QOT07827.1 nucleotide exchange factor GrpE [Paenibacillus sp. JNUCC-32]WFB60391.1 nucleotide exchange factor GrpE [Paenibacillus sp. BR1-192]GIP01776.1 nucleotide exchange factor GrpE [Paenibacillus lautus]
MNNEHKDAVQDTVTEETIEETLENTPNTGESGSPEEAVNPEQEIPVTESADEAAGSAELEKLQAELQEQQQRTLRVQADFDNFRRRTQKEKEDLGKYASSKLITELLPVIDNFERALQASEENPEFESFSKGVSMIFRQLESVLATEGLSAMKSVGEPFNPEYHQAIMQVESDEYEEGIVVEEVQKGYMLKDKVLRPAMVKVSM